MSHSTSSIGQTHLAQLSSIANYQNKQIQGTYLQHLWHPLHILISLYPLQPPPKVPIIITTPKLDRHPPLPLNRLRRRQKRLPPQMPLLTLHIQPINKLNHPPLLRLRQKTPPQQQPIRRIDHVDIVPIPIPPVVLRNHELLHPLHPKRASVLLKRHIIQLP